MIRKIYYWLPSGIRKKFSYYRRFNAFISLYAYLLAKWRMEEKGNTNFLIFCQGRTGSTLLQDMLDQHPQLRCEGEIMQKKYLKPYRYIEGKSKIYKTKAYGFKVLPQQIRIQGFGNSTPFIHYLYNKGWKIIYVRRKNYIRQALSRLIGQQRGRNFRDQKAYNKAPNARIDFKELKASLNGRYYFRKDEKRL